VRKNSIEMPYNKNKGTFYVAVFLVALGTILAICGVLSGQYSIAAVGRVPNMVSIIGVVLGIIGLILLKFSST
jgi:hypothetical protein